MNNRGRYEADLAEAMEEDSEGMQKFLDKEHEEALKSYPEGCDEEVYRYCSICGRLMRYRSMAYDEGFHFDSCV